MPIMRCPSCGKPNPDFLDLCQYCEKPLHPEAPAAPAQRSPAAPAGADETIVAAASVRCQSCGRTNPAHLEVCQYCQARLKPLLAGGAAPAADTAETGGSAVTLMNRLRSMGAGAPAEPGLSAPEPAAAPEPPEEPSPANWMSRLRGMTDPNAIESEPEPEAPVAEVPAEPDWMWTGTLREPTAPSTPAAPPSEPSYSALPTDERGLSAPTPGSLDLPDWLRDPNAAPLPGAGDAPAAKPRRKMTDWLNAQAGASTAPITPPAADDVPDWLRSLAGSTGTLSPAAAPEPGSPAEQRLTPSAAPASTGDDLPDWLKNVRTATPLNSDDAPPIPQASAAHRMQSLPAWMRTEVEAPADAPAPEAPPVPPAPVASAAAPEGLAALPAAEPPAAGPTDTPPDAGSEDLPAWLRAIITPGAADETIPIPAKPKKKKMTDWLGNQPPPPTEAVSADAELPDWLKALSAGDTAPAAAAPSNPVAEGLPDWLKPADGLPADGLPAAPAGEADLPDWLRGVSTEPAAPSTPVSEPPAAPPRIAVSAAAPAAPAPEPVEPEPVASSLAAENSIAAESSFTATTTAADLPDWLTALTPAAGAAADPMALDDATLSWLNTLSGDPAVAEAEGAAAPALDATLVPPAAVAADTPPADEALDLGPVTLPAEAPAWLDELAAAGQAPAAPPAAVSSAAPGIEPTPEAELPDWLKTLRGQSAAVEPAAEAMPDWLRTMRGLPTPADEAPAAENLAAAEAPAPAGATPPAAPDVTLIGKRPAVTPEVINATADATAMPSWLASMRPVDIAQAATGAADSYEETLGVLAGMRGVLRAEPAVALPQRAAPAVNRLEVSELHNAHARLLTELQQTEAAAAPRAGSVRRVAQHIERWVVFALLAAAIVVAQFYLPSFFGPPSEAGQQPAAGAAYQQLINAGAQSHAEGTLPRPALIAFDYDPSQQGELNPAALAIIRQLIGEGVPVVGLSVRPAGAAVGQLLLTQAVADLSTAGHFSYTYGTHYLNLGYLPGGPVGVQQFASQPTSVFNTDFTDAEAFRGAQSVWSAPAVAQVDALDKFSLIVLISGTPQATRTWIEQAQFAAPNVPIIAVVSAAAEPLVSPYLQAPSAGDDDTPQLDGLISGLGGAADLEQRSGQPGAALAAWPGLGGGLLAAAALILIGNLVLGLPALLRRRR